MKLISVLAKFTRSPQGRRMARQAMRYAQSPEGRRRIERGRRRLAARGKRH